MCSRGAAEGGTEGEEEHQEVQGVRGKHLHQCFCHWLCGSCGSFPSELISYIAPHLADVTLRVRVHVCEHVRGGKKKESDDDDDDVCGFSLMTRSLYFPLLHKVPLQDDAHLHVFKLCSQDPGMINS